MDRQLDSMLLLYVDEYYTLSFLVIVNELEICMINPSVSLYNLAMGVLV